tara:strand:+ start:191 stop:388 length:198 start_codon:yes stop_codon:yes gene_type:complete
LINYYAFPGDKTLEESRKSQINSSTFKSGDKKFAIKICNKKFGENKYKLFSFINFNDLNTFDQII